VSIKLAGVLCASFAIGQATSAQSVVHHPSHRQADRLIADNGAFEAGVAQATVQAAFWPETPLSHQQMLSLLLLMSVPRIANSMEGRKP
jgi:hypothetical protein